MTLAAILYRHLGQSVPAVPELSRQSGTTETLAPQPVPVVPAVPEEKQGSNAVTDRQRAFLKREPLVTEADLGKMQRQLLGHLLTCRDCVVEDHLYCQQGGRDGSGYQGFLCEFPYAEQRHTDYVGVVIQARIRGLQAGFTALEALTRQDCDTGRETACRPVYGIDKRPAELAFVNHFTACAFCFPRSGKYCGEGRVLHDMALLEGEQ